MSDCGSTFYIYLAIAVILSTFGVCHVAILFFQLLSILYKIQMCVCVCSLCTASFERTWTKFGTWHRHTLGWSLGVNERRWSSRSARVHTPLQMSGEFLGKL